MSRRRGVIAGTRVGRRSRCRSRSWRRPRRWRSTASRSPALIGRAVPLAFVFALVGVLFVSYAFVQLTPRGQPRRLGVRVHRLHARPARRASSPAGRCSGTYLCFTVASTAEVGLFFSSFLASTGISDSADWIWIALDRARRSIALIAYGDVRVATRSLLTIEGISIALIVILVVVIVVQADRRDRRRRGRLASIVDAFKLPVGHVAGRGRDRRGVRLPLVRRLRGRRGARRGDRRAAPQHPARAVPRAARRSGSSTCS